MNKIQNLEMLGDFMMIHIQKFYYCILYLLLISCAGISHKIEDKMNITISKEQAVTIAKKRALEDHFEMFKEPFLDSVVRQKDTDHWVIKLLSVTPRSNQGLSLDGARYMFVTVDKITGAVLAVDSGGGS